LGYVVYKIVPDGLVQVRHFGDIEKGRRHINCLAFFCEAAHRAKLLFDKPQREELSGYGA